MNGQPYKNKSFLESILGFYETNHRLFYVFRRLVFWVVVWLFERYYFSPRLYKDNLDVIATGSTISFIQTVSLYYLLGHVILPKFLYKRRYVIFIVLILSVFFIIYQINYKLLNFLLTISNSTNSEETYVKKIVLMLTEAGWIGCFTDLTVFLWNYAYSFFFVTLILTVKIIKDVIGYQKRMVIIERDKFALELDFLKSQVNPHFLFNTLNSVYARIFDTDEKAADLILRLSELMRYNLYETNLPTISLDKELDYIQNYLNLERNRLSDRYVVIDYEQSGDASAYQITPLLLITFVENAFKHGIKGAKKPAYVQIRADIMANQLVFRVENSVPEKLLVVADSDKKSGGIGLDNIRKRLAALYQDNHQLIINTSENTYEVTLTIKLKFRRQSEGLDDAN